MESSQKLWIYTNYDCNLTCTYCVAKSGPRVPRRALGLEAVERLVDEASASGFSEVLFTGGEPFLLDEIYAMLEYAAERLPTTALTNGMLLHGKRLERLRLVQHPNLAVQVSLDGAQPEHHDPYRGRGSWEKAIRGICNLLEHGFRVRLATTETPLNAAHLEELCAFHLALGIPEEAHLVRPLARRGFSKEGLELDLAHLAPEITVNVDGVFWHPLSTEADMQVSASLFPLSTALERIAQQQETIARTGQAAPITFT